MKNNYNFKPFDKVLVRDYDHETWEANFFKSKKEICGKDVLYYCISAVWNQCIPYEGNEHLLGTTDSPKRYNSNNDTLFEIKLKPGYVLEFENGSMGVLFPIRKTESPDETFFAVMFDNGSWDKLDDIDLETITAIRGIPYYDCCLTSSEYLWEKEY